MGAGGRGNPNVAAPLVGAVGAGAVGQGGWERLIPQCPKEAGHNELAPTSWLAPPVVFLLPPTGSLLRSIVGSARLHCDSRAS